MHNGVVHSALKEAEKSTERYRIGAVIFKGRKIISKAHNELRHNASIHPKYKRFEFSVHAEQKAIIQARCNLKRCSILVVSINKRGDFLLAKPCKYCQAYLDEVGIKDIYYTTKTGIIKECNSASV